MNISRCVKQSAITTISLWLLLFALIPFTLLLVVSFLSHNDSQLIILHVTLSNYHQLLSGVFFKILRNSFYLAGSCTIIILLIAYPTAWLLAHTHPRWKNLLFLLMIIPFWTSALIRTYAILTLIKAKGIINNILIALHLIQHPLPILFSNTAVIIGIVYNLLPFMVMPLYNNFEKLDPAIYEAARDLGASGLTIFRKLTLPLTLPGIVSGIIFVFLPAMTLFYIPDLLGGAKNLLVGNLVKNQVLLMNDWPGGAATSIVLTVLLLLLAWIYRAIDRNKQQDIL